MTEKGKEQEMEKFDIYIKTSIHPMKASREKKIKKNEKKNICKS